MSVGGEVQLCTSKAWVFQPILPNLTFAFVTAFTPCTLSHNIRPFRNISINRRRDADFGAHLLQRRPSYAEPLGSKTCCPSHDNQLNGFVSCFRHTSCVRRLSLEVSAQGAHTELPRGASCQAHATHPLRVFRNTSCWAHAAPCRAHAIRLAELPVKLCPSPTPFPLPSKTWQSPSARLWKETGVRPGNRSNRSENRSVPSRNRSNRTKNPAFGLENRSRLSQRTGRTRIGGHPHQNRRTGRARIGRHPHQNRKTSTPESEEQPHLIAKTPTWRTSKPQFSSRICILGVAGLPYNL